MSDESACPDENTLVAMLLGQSSSAELDELEAHFDTCPACMLLLTELAQVLPTETHSFALGQRPLDSSTSFGLSRGCEPFADFRLPASEPHAERYALLECVGEGGMGAVYRALDTRLGRHVALKVLRPDIDGEARRAALTARLQREARLLAGLSHPNVLTIHDVGLWRGQVYIAAEFIEGQTLSGWLSAAPRAWRELLPLFIQAANGLAAAHDAGLVHRDIKPDNLMLDTQGRVRVMDFGLASPTEPLQDVSEQSHSPPGSLVMTRTGDVFGTPAYMSPEQHRGESAGPASDQFSFCASLFEAVYGVRPFVGHSQEALAEAACAGRITEAPRKDVPAALHTAIRKGLSVDPMARHASIHALAETLERILRAPPSRSSRWKWTVIAALTAMGLTLAVLANPFFAAPSASTAATARCRLGEAYSASFERCLPRGRCEGGAFFVEGRCLSAPAAFSKLASACQEQDTLACIELGEALLEEGEQQNPPLGIDLLRRGCDAQSAKGCYALAPLFFDGEHLERNVARGLKLYERACEGGHTLACNDLGVLLTKGEEVEPDLERGWQLLTQACDKGFAMACFNLAGFFASGRHVPQDLERASSLHASACKWLHGPSCRWLASYYSDGIWTETRLELALEYWIEGCAASDGLSCHHLGGVYRQGLGVEKDMTKAVSAYEDACRLGHAPSCYNAGHFLQLGEEVVQDRERGFQLFDRGCVLNDPRSCYYSGRFHLILGDLEEGISALQRACDAEYVDGCIDLGRLFLHGGHGASLEPARAFPYYQRACALKNGPSCEQAGDMLETGQLGEKKTEGAVALYRQGCALAHSESCVRVVRFMAEGVVLQ